MKTKILISCLAISLLLIGMVVSDLNNTPNEDGLYTETGIVYSNTNGFSPATSTAFPKPEGKVIRIFSGGKD